jgi:2-polyprenyl-3-methyl-5-hydroxy-6-metoxy-1,4-benzoquinol methylase
MQMSSFSPLTAKDSTRCFSTIPTFADRQSQPHEETAVETCYPTVTGDSHFVEIDPEEHPVTLSEPEMCVQAIIDIMYQKFDNPLDASGYMTGPKVLDFCAGNGQMGHLLAENGFSEVYGQEGSKSKE